MNVINRQWITAGHAIFTVQTSPEAVAAGYATHYTYRVERVEMPAKGPYPASVRHFIGVLRGQDNTNDYVYMGMIDANTGSIKLTTKSAFPSTAKRFRIACRVLARVWAGETDKINAGGWSIHHAGCCGKCGKTLTVPESVKAGYGPECVKMVTGMKLAEYAAKIG